MRILSVYCMYVDTTGTTWYLYCYFITAIGVVFCFYFVLYQFTQLLLQTTNQNTCYSTCIQFGALSIYLLKTKHLFKIPTVVVYQKRTICPMSVYVYVYVYVCVRVTYVQIEIFKLAWHTIGRRKQIIQYVYRYTIGKWVSPLV